MYIKTFFACPLLLLIGCNTPNPDKASSLPVQEATTASANISDMKWLMGKWQHAAEGKIAYEYWKQLNDSSLQAVSGTIHGTDTTIEETVLLQQKGQDLFYIPTVKDQNGGKAVPFKLTSATATDFVFENPTHDFPQLISYSKKSANSLLAKISGKVNGKEQKVLFPMYKIE